MATTNITAEQLAKLRKIDELAREASARLDELMVGVRTGSDARLELEQALWGLGYAREYLDLSPEAKRQPS
jgi:hypothetical protein